MVSGLPVDRGRDIVSNSIAYDANKNDSIWSQQVEILSYIIIAIILILQPSEYLPRSPISNGPVAFAIRADGSVPASPHQPTGGAGGQPPIARSGGGGGGGGGGNRMGAFNTG